MMSDPITTIDLGNSGSSDAVATPWEETRRVLETAEVFWLATVRADGRPHVTPVAAAWLDGTLYFGTGGIAQKLKHLRGNRHVVLTTGCNQLATGFDIVVEATGSVKILEDSINYVRRGGKLVVYGVYGSKDRVTWPPSKIFGDEITILGSFSETYKFPAAIDYLGMYLVLPTLPRYDG